MGERTGISWCDHTFNPWIGCVRVSEACRNCYAESMASRFYKGTWGPQGRRKFQSDSYWAQPLKWNRKAERDGVRRRVFCASMCDVFEKLPEGHPDVAAMGAARSDLWALIDETPHLDWLLLTKRPENVRELALGFDKELPPNIWLGTTVEDQATAEKRIPHLLDVAARVRFLSAEPLLGPIDLEHIGNALFDRDAAISSSMYGPAKMNWDQADHVIAHPQIHWVICGGESGAGARSMHPDWARSLRDQCIAARVAFHFKQWGAWADAGQMPDETYGALDGRPQFENGIPNGLIRVGKKHAGRLLDGREWNEVPTPCA